MYQDYHQIGLNPCYMNCKVGHEFYLFCGYDLLQEQRFYYIFGNVHHNRLPFEHIHPMLNYTYASNENVSYDVGEFLCVCGIVPNCRH